jgi:hypothetical protein
MQLAKVFATTFSLSALALSLVLAPARAQVQINIPGMGGITVGGPGGVVINGGQPGQNSSPNSGPVNNSGTTTTTTTQGPNSGNGAPPAATPLAFVPVGCEAKGALWVATPGNLLTQVPVITSGGASPAAPNYGNSNGFKTAPNGKFKVTFTPDPRVTATSAEFYWFRMEAWNSTYLNYGIPGTPYYTSMARVGSPESGGKISISGQELCGTATPSKTNGIAFDVVVTPPPVALLEDCFQLVKKPYLPGKTTHSGEACKAWRGYSPIYYTSMPAPGVNGYSLFMDRSLVGNNAIARCANPESVLMPAAILPALPPVNPASGVQRKAAQCVRAYKIILPVGTINSHFTIAAPTQNWALTGVAADGDQLSD